MRTTLVYIFISLRGGGDALKKKKGFSLVKPQFAISTSHRNFNFWIFKKNSSRKIVNSLFDRKFYTEKHETGHFWVKPLFEDG